jgi:hypothetical protein
VETIQWYIVPVLYYIKWYQVQNGPKEERKKLKTLNTLNTLNTLKTLRG